MANPKKLIFNPSRSSDAVAMVDEPQSYTVDELTAKAAATATALSPLVRQGERVIVSIHNGPDFFAGLVGCWAAAAVPVVLDPMVRSELSYAAEMTGAKTVIYSGEAGLPCGLTAVDPKTLPEGLPEITIPEVADDAPILYLFTSGSTGKPTLVPKTFRQIEVEVDFIAGLFERPMQVAGLVPWCHIWGLLSTFFVPLKTGGVCDLRGGISARGVLEHVAEGTVDLVVAVPVYYQAMVRLMEEGVVPPFGARCRFASSSAPLSPEIRQRFKALSGVSITDIFGSTETGGIAYRHEDGPWRIQPHVATQIDAEGRLRVKSDSVSFQTDDGYFAIGDMVEEVEGGFVLLGRQDDVVKIGGRRMALGEITRAVESCPGVFRAAVLTENIAGTLRLTAFVEPKDETLTGKAVKSHVRTLLADHKVPRTVHLVASLPIMPSGKIDRRKLLEMIPDSASKRAGKDG